MNNNGYQVPWIPYSRLKEMYRTAQTLTLEEDAGVDAKWVWTMLVRQEADRLMILHYQKQIQDLTTILVKVSETSINQVNELMKENKDIRDQNTKLINTMANYIHEDWPEWKEMQPTWTVRKGENSGSD
jgi:hypothetical protein